MTEARALPQIIIAAVALAMIVIEVRRGRAIDQIDEPKRRPATIKSKGCAE